MSSVLSRPFRSVFANRRLISAFVRQDIRGRYVASVLGLSWAVIQPLALLLLYTFVFSSILRLRYGQSDSTASFGAYLFCGLLPWFAVSDSLTRAANVVIANGNLIKKVIFPSDILPVYVVVSAIVIEFIGLGVFFVVLLLSRAGLGWECLLLVVVIVLQFLLTTGMAWLLASLNVFLRDVGQLLGLGLTIWLFLTPVFYPENLIPEQFRLVLTLNPMFYVVDAYRDLIMEQRLPAGSHLATLALMGVVVFVIGHWFFQRSSKAFIDVL